MPLNSARLFFGIGAAVLGLGMAGGCAFREMTLPEVMSLRHFPVDSYIHENAVRPAPRSLDLPAATELVLKNNPQLVYLREAAEVAGNAATESQDTIAAGNASIRELLIEVEERRCAFVFFPGRKDQAVNAEASLC